MRTCSGIWIAHGSGTNDWEQYLEVNRRFAAAVCSEARTELDPVAVAVA